MGIDPSSPNIAQWCTRHFYHTSNLILVREAIQQRNEARDFFLKKITWSLCFNRHRNCRRHSSALDSNAKMKRKCSCITQGGKSLVRTENTFLQPTTNTQLQDRHFSRWQYNVFHSAKCSVCVGTNKDKNSLTLKCIGFGCARYRVEISAWKPTDYTESNRGFPEWLPANSSTASETGPRKQLYAHIWYLIDRASLVYIIKKTIN